MYRLEREEFTRTRLVSLWALLGFQAGFINAFGFLACGRFVSHVTGFGTQIGLAMAQNNGFLALELLGFPASFMLGSFLSGAVTVARLERGKKPLYDKLVLAFPVLLGILMLISLLGVFGEFGEHRVIMNDLVLLFSLSFVCGMQNGCFATMTRGQIRTTHLTGISTDLGTDLARVLFGKLNPTELEVTRRTNYSRIATFVAFAGGSIVSVLVSDLIHYKALLVPMITSTIVALAVNKVTEQLEQKLNQNSPNLVQAS